MGYQQVGGREVPKWALELLKEQAKKKQKGAKNDDTSADNPGSTTGS